MKKMKKWKKNGIRNILLEEKKSNDLTHTLRS